MDNTMEKLQNYSNQHGLTYKITYWPNCNLHNVTLENGDIEVAWAEKPNLDEAVELVMAGNKFQ